MRDLLQWILFVLAGAGLAVGLGAVAFGVTVLVAFWPDDD